MHESATLRSGAAQGRPQFGEMLLGREKGARFMPGALAAPGLTVNERSVTVAAGA